MSNRLGVRVGGAATAVIALMLTTAAGHALSADEVWGLWQKQYSGYGYDIAAAQQLRSGDTLVLGDVTMKSGTASDAFELTIPEVRLRELGDGRVEARFSPEATGQSRSKPAEGPELVMDMAIGLRDTVALVSGTIANTRYSVTAPELTIEMTEVVTATPAPGAEGGPAQLEPTRLPMRMKMTATGVSGDHAILDGDLQREDATATVRQMKLTMTGADVQSEAAFAMTGTVDDLAMTSRALMPRAGNVDRLGAALAEGMRLEAQGTYGASDFALEAQGEAGTMTLKVTGESGSFDTVMAPEGFRQSGTGRNTVIDMTGGGAPMPLSASLEMMTFTLAAPLTQSEAPQPFAAQVGLIDLRLSDGVWGIFDPQGRLARDPASVELDIAGTARPLANLFDPAVAQGTNLPVEVDSLELKSLRIAAAGAELTGAGAVTFDNSGETAVPVGSADLSLTGAVGLMENLIAMGLLPQDRMMFMRMVLGLYAVPAGEDHFTSKIDFEASGEILANGQRIR